MSDLRQTRIISWSEISDMRQCPHKHDLGYRQRWVPPEVSPALARGTLWHLVMQAHYLELREIQKERKKGILSLTSATADRLKKAVIPLLYDDALHQTPQQELVEWMYVGYVTKWGADAQWRVLAVEHEALVPLPTPGGGRSTFRVKMKIDLIVRDMSLAGEPLWIVDHKTTKDLSTDREVELDDQFGLYTWGMRQLGRPVIGSVRNEARTQRNQGPMQLDDRFKRIRMNRPDEELTTIANEAYETAASMYGRWREGEAPRYPNSETCRYRCQFLEPCLAGRKGYDEVRFLVDRGFMIDKERH